MVQKYLPHSFCWRRKRMINGSLELRLIGFKTQVHYLIVRFFFNYRFKIWTISSQTEAKGERDILSFDEVFTARLLHFCGKSPYCKTFSLHLWKSFVNKMLAHCCCTCSDLRAANQLLQTSWATRTGSLPDRTKSTILFHKGQRFFICGNRWLLAADNKHNLEFSKNLLLQRNVVITIPGNNLLRLLIR